MAHNLKIGEKTFNNVEKITVNDTSGNPVEFIVPSINKTINSNGTYSDAKNWASVTVNVSTTGDSIDLSEYIKKTDTWNYTLKDNFKEGGYKPPSDIPIGNFELNGFGFKPKIFIIRNYSGITGNTSKNYITCSWFIRDNNYNYREADINFSDDSIFEAARSSCTHSVASSAGAASQGSDNTLSPTDDGVAGKLKIDPNATPPEAQWYFQGGQKYIWYAWG